MVAVDVPHTKYNIQTMHNVSYAVAEMENESYGSVSKSMHDRFQEMVQNTFDRSIDYSLKFNAYIARYISNWL